MSPEEDPPAVGRHGPGWRRWLLIGGAVIVAILVAGAIVLLARKPHNVSHPDLSFTVTKPTATTSTRPTRQAADDFAWPYYGYNAARTRDFTGDANLHPPFRQGWAFGHNALLEFPPSISGHALYFMDDSATVKAVDTVTGRLIWQRTVGTLSAATPALAVAQGILVVPTLSDDSHSPGDGQIIALSMRTGAVLWHRAVASGTESSALVHDNTVFLGSQSGTVYALNVKTGHVDWTFQASAAVKGGLALSGDTLYLDDYGGHVYAISARNGHQIWESSADGGDLGFSSGTFYSTPAVAFGRVYVGNTSGYVYSFAAGNGQLAWSYGTGAYVYASASVADVPGVGPTVYMGSYNGDFYAFNAQSGKVRWVHEDAHHDAISGSSTVVDGVVYYSDLHDHLTTGLDAASGKTVFSFDDGAFTPVVADEDHLYLAGGYVLYELLPETALTGTATSPATTRRHSGRSRATVLAVTAARERAGAHRRELARIHAAETRTARRRAAAERAAAGRAASKRAEEERAARRRVAQRRAGHRGHHRHVRRR